jgi:hypothetical protein
LPAARTDDAPPAVDRYLLRGTDRLAAPSVMDNSDGKGRVLEMEKPGMFAGLGVWKTSTLLLIFSQTYV